MVKFNSFNRLSVRKGCSAVVAPALGVIIMHALSRTAFTAAAPFALAALLLSSTSALAQSEAQPLPPQASPAPAPQAAVPDAVPASADAPSVVLSRRLVAAASAFETYTARAGAIRADFSDAASVSQALQTGSAYEPKQIQAGEIAYAAIVALQDPAFVEGALRWARNPQAATDLLADPSVIARMPAAQEAAARVSAALRERGGLVLKAGQQVKQSAYDIQHQPWSLARVADPQGVLAKSKALSQIDFTPAPEDTARLVKSAAVTPAGGDASALAMPVVQRSLALAALAVMGKAGDGSEAALQPLLADAKSNDCMRMAKLNLYQCLAVAGPHYEDVFCLGQHGLMDTGQCVIAAATPRPGYGTQLASRASWSPTPGAMLIPVASVSAASPQP
jgi:hypothetical protein